MLTPEKLAPLHSRAIRRLVFGCAGFDSGMGEILTAQGGGGSFKNRKPIGEIGCCESGMAERIH